MSGEVEVKYKILSEHLIWVDETLIDELISFLEEKLGSDVVISRDRNFILIGLSKDQDLSKRTLKVYIKRFLHKYELLDRLRVISGDKDSYIIHKRRGIEVTRF
ncbi:MAG: 60S ribosomal protein L22 [Candidatus Helarchaeota archaeon]|nr:60S ribosomal protein L22 [Candidatus Helarchaeota archaeon]